MDVTVIDVDKTSTMGLPNHFAELGLELRYAVDKQDLEARYLDRSKQVHPDRFVGADSSMRIAALSASMGVNEAYRVLKDDRLRAEHLLAHRGVVIGDHEQLDPTFLMSILEAREELSEALAAGDQSEVMRLEDAMLDRRDELLSSVASLFASVDAAGPDAPDVATRLAEIKQELILLRYVVRYLEAATADE